MNDNLPPGIESNMIPGNTPEDEAWERFIDWMTDQADKHSLSPEELQSIISKALDKRDR